MRPYKETELGDNQYIREFSSDVDDHELDWIVRIVLLRL